MLFASEAELHLKCSQTGRSTIYLVLESHNGQLQRMPVFETLAHRRELHFSL